MPMCRICLSPYRDELKKAWEDGFPRKVLYEKYVPLIWSEKKITFDGFSLAWYRHSKHNPPPMVVVGPAAQGQVKYDSMGIAKMISQLYAMKVEKMNPEDVSYKEYTAVNKLVLDEKKLQMDRDSQMLALAQLFGIPQVIQGEEVKNELESPKGEGDQPSNPQ